MFVSAYSPKDIANLKSEIEKRQKETDSDETISPAIENTPTATTITTTTSTTTNTTSTTVSPKENGQQIDDKIGISTPLQKTEIVAS